MTIKLGKYEIPFDLDGNMIDTVRAYMKDPIMRPNGIVDLELTFARAYGYRTNSYYFRDQNDKNYRMFESDFWALIPHLVKGKFEGKFYFRKHGNVYGIVAILPKEEAA